MPRTTRLGMLRLGMARFGGNALRFIALGFISPATTVFAPTLSGRKLDLGFIAPATTVFPPTLRGSDQSVTLDFIASATVVYDIKVQPAARKIVLGGCGTNTALYPITLTGGASAVGLAVFIGGKVATNVLQGTMTLSSNTSGRWTASFSFVDPDGTWSGAPILPADETRGCGVSVVISENGVRLFSGFINQITGSRFLSQAGGTYQVGCLDMSSMADHRIINATYAAGSELADAVRDIWETALQTEGITANHVAATIDVLALDEKFNVVPATQALDQLATDSGCVWWVDALNDLWFVPIDAMTTAPFNITETSKNWRNAQVQVSMATYRNKQWILSNLNSNPNSISEITETYTLPQPAAVARGFRLAAIVLNFSATAIQSIKVNGTPQPWQDGNEIGTNLDKSWWSVLPSPYLNGPDSTLPTATPPLGWPYASVTSPFPSADDVVEIKYIPDLTNAVLDTTAALTPPTDLQLAGSGIWEAVQQVPDLTDPVQMKALATAILARKGTVPFFFGYETDTPGLQIGMRQTVNLPANKIPTTVITITSLSGVRLPGKGKFWRWQVQGNDGADLDNELKWLEKMYSRSNFPLPLNRYETASFVLAPGGSIAGGGTVATNPHIVAQSGRLLDVYVQAGVPPVDQDLYIDIVNSAYGSVLGGLSKRIRIPAGSLDLVHVTVFVFDPAPTFILVGQSLTIVADYIQTGPNPTRAGSVSVMARWAF